MDSRSLHRTLRRIVLASLASPLVLPIAACGGRTAGDDWPAVDDDAGATDGGIVPRHDGGHPSLDAFVPPPPPPPPPPPVCDTMGKPDGSVPPCGYNVTLVDGSEVCGFPDGGTPTPAMCTFLCGAQTDYCYIEPPAPGAPGYVGCGNGCEGRRPAGLRWTGPRRARDIGGHFARAAQLEAASVYAFRALRDELVAHGAPARLVRAAERAERDEVRHTRVTAALARRFGAEPRAPRVDAHVVRSLEEVARENAVEGCVRETYGALLGTWQALAAEDRVVRAAMRKIAADETRHAALAWEVAAWANERLDPAARRRVEEARAEEARKLHAELAEEPPASLVRIGGVPTAARARSLAEAMNRALAS
jgi:hypothetical protein